MAFSTPTTEPAALRAGDTWTWRRDDLGDYPASSWTLAYYFRNASAHFDITAAADGNAYLVTVAKATTAPIAAGWYDWIAVATSATERYQVDQGRAEVLPDFATAAAHDARTTSRKLLDYVEAMLLGRASSGQIDIIETTLADRGLKRESGGLMKLRSQLASEVAREDAANGRKTGGTDRSKLLIRLVSR